MASGGKGYYAAQAASSSASGGDPAQEWVPAESLRQVAEQRVAQWREAEGLQDDNDFAYAYIDFDQWWEWQVIMSQMHGSLLELGSKKGFSQPEPGSWRATPRVLLSSDRSASIP